MQNQLIEGALFGLAAAVLWGSADFLSRGPSQRIGYYSTSSLVQLFGFTGLLTYLGATNGIDAGLLLSNRTLLVYNFFAGIAMFAAILFLYRGYAKGVMSVAAPVASAYPVVTVLLSALVLGVALSGAKQIGIFIVIAGTALAGIRFSKPEQLGKRPNRSRGQRNKRGQPLIGEEERGVHVREQDASMNRKKAVEGLDSALVSCVSLGLAFFALGIVTPVFGVLVPVMIMRGIAGLSSLALFRPLRQKISLPRGRGLLTIVLLSILDTLGFVVFSFGILSAGNSLPVVVTLSGLVGVITVSLASAFYHERLDLIQYSGIIVIFVGVSIILYF